MAVIDQAGGNANAGISAGVNDRPVKAYQWVCTNPGCPNPNQIGRVEDGCKACGAGADAKQGSPLPPTDYNCQACRGTGTVERKCGVCDGTGMLAAPSLGEAPPTCDKCGGSGSIALGCGRCDGSGIDPQPVKKPVASHEETARVTPVAPSTPSPAMPSAQAGIFGGGAAARAVQQGAGLPSIDDGLPVTVTPPDTVVRYRLVRYEGPADVVDRTITQSLSGRWQEPSGMSIIAIEIAAPKGPAVLQQIADTDAGTWPARTKF